MIEDWSSYPNFTKREFDCKFTGENDMQPEFMERLQAVRTEYGKPMLISSAYRSPKHPNERDKDEPGAHTEGRAADIITHGPDALQIIELALKHGFTGIGVSQKGSTRFIHLDDIPPGHKHFPRPTIWSY